MKIDSVVFKHNTFVAPEHVAMIHIGELCFIGIYLDGILFPFTTYKGEKLFNLNI